MDNTTAILLGGLFGGSISALINLFFAYFANKKERNIKFLDDQVRKLYGPLYYFISQSERLFEINKKFHDAYNKEYVEKKYNTAEFTRKTLREETTETINLANEYIKIVEKNNFQIEELLRKNPSFIDPDDIDLFLKFYEDHIRLVTEKDDEGKMRTPFMIYERIGDISLLRPVIIERVKKKFLKKKNELDSLIKE